MQGGESREDMRLAPESRPPDLTSDACTQESETLVRSEFCSRGEAQRHRLPGSEEGAGRAPQSRRRSFRRPVRFVLLREVYSFERA